ncbi:Glucokinase regulatory protein [Collichthys lucidus]|uniref:Glucokinase regulatory protein n=1 Tax=Collichthys lucidus TaxID=240159 RepID=A0A4U5TZ84_COLLU|nr:Glucokinase regulatory protein [Collichthys lucidus]
MPRLKRDGKGDPAASSKSKDLLMVWCQANMPHYVFQSPDYEPSLPVSEKSNPLTRDIDRASANCIVQMLQACDAQMFQEETGATYQRLLSEQVVETLMEVAQRVELILKDPQDSLVVLSGCGTSGRMAFLITVCEGKKRVLFIGISCGLSAPFVAGQLDFCLRHSDVYTPVLVGFNPAHQARDEPMPGSTLTFRSVVQRMQALAKSHKAFLLNPAVGPEAISGSSRMKGGSATKILLEVVMSAAHAAAFANTPITYKGVLQRMKAYEQTLDITYAQSEGMTALLEAAGQSLRRGGRVCYLGWGSLAVLGLVDASECDPTFGAGERSVMYADNTVQNHTQGPGFCIAHEDFLRLVLPSLTDKDFVLLLYTHSDDVSEVVKLARRWELSTKLVLNAVSTGAHVLKGKIYHNHMIDVQATNSKLYCRATRLLQKLSGCPQSQCEEALLKAIYQVDKLTVDITSSDINTHTRAARNRTKVRMH